MSVALSIAKPADADTEGDLDLSLRDEIRMLGRVLGDTLRDQEGKPCSPWWSRCAASRRASIARRMKARGTSWN